MRLEGIVKGSKDVLIRRPKEAVGDYVALMRQLALLTRYADTEEKKAVGEFAIGIMTITSPLMMPAQIAYRCISNKSLFEPDRRLLPYADLGEPLF